MSSTTSSCWACQSSVENGQGTCRICSTTYLRKASMPKPQNAIRPRGLPSISTPCLLRLYSLYCYNKASISKALADFRTMTARAPTPEHNLPPIFLLSHALPQAIPNISLTGPEGAYPTIDFNTFNVLSSGVQNLRDLQVLLPQTITRRKHKRGNNCVRCCEAAWADAYFAEGMQMEK
ncbi:hypothetical protein BDU57DRAFT_494021 [Ampelomyces quisqualis]|uniref:Uncharacterized protein n=1 Tax=Ampelomyces quisqualis TaxID=50730 RepID=A0A6A5QT78_AMPQU|nr:hypothetical protein BDU57DRAFT_494021 [Ampelomyces quisqualis]